MTTRSREELLGLGVGSPWQLSAEARGASAMADTEGNRVPYADLLEKCADAIDDLRHLLERSEPTGPTALELGAETRRLGLQEQ